MHGEQRYGAHGGKRTSDVAIDLGLDLVLIEVVSARFATDVRVYGNPEILTAALERMLFKKMGQLGRVTGSIDALRSNPLSGMAGEIPDLCGDGIWRAAGPADDQHATVDEERRRVRRARDHSRHREQRKCAGRWLEDDTLVPG